MPQWRVRDVMTTEVMTVPDDASVAEIVAVLTDRQITAVPIVDRFDVVLGVVSWTDLRDKIGITGWAVSCMSVGGASGRRRWCNGRTAPPWR
jgi:CBS domain-containing protein